MSKYIDKEVLLERMNRTRPYEGEDGSFERHRRLQWLADMGQVNMCPATDVKEVKHGRWVDVEPAPHNLFYATCSVCGDRQTIEVANYCPMCGASMDEVSE